MFFEPTQSILKSGVQVAKVPEDTVTEKRKSSVELAANAGELGGRLGVVKQKKPPLPSHPPEFRPPGTELKPAGGVAVEKLMPAVVKAKACTADRPPSVSEGPLMPLMWRSKEAVVAFNGDVFCRV